MKKRESVVFRQKTNMTLYEIGRMIYRGRKNKGWSQSDLAAKLGVTNTYISEIENGHKRAGSKTFYDEIAILLGISFDMSFPLKEGRPKKIIDEDL